MWESIELSYFGLRIADLKSMRPEIRVRSQPFDRLRAGIQNPGEKQSELSFCQLLATGY
jgi:hypothetical protein